MTTTGSAWAVWGVLAGVILWAVSRWFLSRCGARYAEMLASMAAWVGQHGAASHRDRALEYITQLDEIDDLAERVKLAAGLLLCAGPRMVFDWLVWLLDKPLLWIARVDPQHLAVRADRVRYRSAAAAMLANSLCMSSSCALLLVMVNGGSPWRWIPIGALMAVCIMLFDRALLSHVPVNFDQSSNKAEPLLRRPRNSVYAGRIFFGALFSIIMADPIKEAVFSAQIELPEGLLAREIALQSSISHSFGALAQYVAIILLVAGLNIAVVLFQVSGKRSAYQLSVAAEMRYRSAMTSRQLDQHDGEEAAIDEDNQGDDEEKRSP